MIGTFSIIGFLDQGQSGYKQQQKQQPHYFDENMSDIAGSESDIFQISVIKRPQIDKAAMKTLLRE